MGRKFAAVVFSLGCLQASTALALGLGEFQLESHLNEPLQGSVDLLNMGSLHEDEIKIRLGTREDFKRLGLDRPFFLTSIEFDVVVDDDGRGRILMSTDDPVLEPYLDFIVEARWPTGRLLREYTVLIDPPTFSDSASVVEVSASERVEEVEGIPAPAKKKEQADTTDGTKVDVRKSDLAPGEMPERDFSADSSSSPNPGSRYMVRRDETLWSIASRARPEGASVHQTMLDIQRLNPDAFINNNINRVKAGYIIYLPSAGDISSENLAAALDEVREQNEAWRAGRDAELAATSGPRLRIAADSQAQDSAAEESRAGADESDPGASSGASGPSRTAGTADETGGEGIDAAVGERNAAMERRLQTLERIVDLKDEQIAALQAALADAREEADSDDASAPGEDMADAGDQAEVAELYEDQSRAGTTGEPAPGEEVPGEPLSEESEADATSPAVVDGSAPEEADQIAAESTAESAPAEAPVASAADEAEQTPEEAGGIANYLLYIAAALLLALLGLFLWRRRSEEDEGVDSEALVAGVPVREEDRPVEQHVPPSTTPEPQPEPEPAVPPVAADRDNRGYGERRHDAYASDVEASDALAEADIYIAYGRHPQAIELLRGALQNEPENPVYRLKLLEIHVELNDRDAAISEFEHIRRSGDRDSIARGEQLLAGLEVADEPGAAEEATPVGKTGGAANDGPGLPPNPLDLMDEESESLEGDFDDLEIEQAGAAREEEVPEELDLSADFEDEEADDDEELVIAADSNGLSTKLDLARAYLDMGDDEGARQILEEIIAEGNDELRIEAQALLDRIE